MKTGSAAVVFALILAASAAAWAQPKPITAREVVAQIQKQIGIPWKA